jgi:hypothetical protein
LSYLDKAVADKTHKIGKHAQDYHVDVACKANFKLFLFQKISWNNKTLKHFKSKYKKSIKRYIPSRSVIGPLKMRKGNEVTMPKKYVLLSKSSIFFHEKQ